MAVNPVLSLRWRPVSPGATRSLQGLTWIAISSCRGLTAPRYSPVTGKTDFDPNPAWQTIAWSGYGWGMPGGWSPRSAFQIRLNVNRFVVNWPASSILDPKAAPTKTSSPG